MGGSLDFVDDIIDSVKGAIKDPFSKEALLFQAGASVTAGSGIAVSGQAARLLGQTAVSAGVLGGGRIIETVADLEAAREQRREANLQALQTRTAVEEQAELLRLQARRDASTQQARQGASGVRGSTGFIVQETLQNSFDEIRRLRKAGSLEAFQLQRQGRRIERAADVRAVGAGVSAVTDVLRLGLGFV